MRLTAVVLLLLTDLVNKPDYSQHLITQRNKFSLRKLGWKCIPQGNYCCNSNGEALDDCCSCNLCLSLSSITFGDPCAVNDSSMGCGPKFQTLEYDGPSTLSTNFTLTIRNTSPALMTAFDAIQDVFMISPITAASMGVYDLFKPCDLQKQYGETTHWPNGGLRLQSSTISTYQIPNNVRWGQSWYQVKCEKETINTFVPNKPLQTKDPQVFLTIRYICGHPNDPPAKGSYHPIWILRYPGPAFSYMISETDAGYTDTKVSTYPMSTFFQINGAYPAPDDCQFESCLMYESDCVTPNTQVVPVYSQVTNQLTLNVMTSSVQTPAKTLCIKCTTNGLVGANTTISYEILANCEYYLTLPTIPSKLIYTLNPLVNPATIKLADPTTSSLLPQCPVNSAILLDQFNNNVTQNVLAIQNSAGATLSQVNFNNNLGVLLNVKLRVYTFLDHYKDSNSFNIEVIDCLQRMSMSPFSAGPNLQIKKLTTDFTSPVVAASTFMATDPYCPATYELRKNGAPYTGTCLTIDANTGEVNFQAPKTFCKDTNVVVRMTSTAQTDAFIESPPFEAEHRVDCAQHVSAISPSFTTLSPFQKFVTSASLATDTFLQSSSYYTTTDSMNCPLYYSLLKNGVPFDPNSDPVSPQCFSLNALGQFTYTSSICERLNLQLSVTSNWTFVFPLTSSFDVKVEIDCTPNLVVPTMNALYYQFVSVAATTLPIQIATSSQFYTTLPANCTLSGQQLLQNGVVYSGTCTKLNPTTQDTTYGGVYCQETDFSIKLTATNIYARVFTKVTNLFNVTVEADCAPHLLVPTMNALYSQFVSSAVTTLPIIIADQSLIQNLLPSYCTIQTIELLQSGSVYFGTCAKLNPSTNHTTYGGVFCNEKDFSIRVKVVNAQLRNFIKETNKFNVTVVADCLPNLVVPTPNAPDYNVPYANVTLPLVIANHLGFYSTLPIDCPIQQLKLLQNGQPYSGNCAKLSSTTNDTTYGGIFCQEKNFSVLMTATNMMGTVFNKETNRFDVNVTVDCDYHMRVPSMQILYNYSLVNSSVIQNLTLKDFNKLIDAQFSSTDPVNCPFDLKLLKSGNESNSDCISLNQNKLEFLGQYCDEQGLQIRMVISNGTSLFQYKDTNIFSVSVQKYNCTPDLSISDVLEQYVTVLTEPLLEEQIKDKYLIVSGQYQSNKLNCTILSYEFEYESFNATVDKKNITIKDFLIFDKKTGQLKYTGNFGFAAQVKVRITSYWNTSVSSKPFYVQVWDACETPAFNLIMPNSISYYKWLQLSEGTQITMPMAECSIMECCLNITYNITHSKTLFNGKIRESVSPLLMAAPILQKDSQTVFIWWLDAEHVNTWVYYLFAYTKYKSVFSEPITVEIVYNCEFDKLIGFNLGSAKLKKGEPPLLMVLTQLPSDKEKTLSLANHFINNASQWCNIGEWEISLISNRTNPNKTEDVIIDENTPIKIIKSSGDLVVKSIPWNSTTWINIKVKNSAGKDLKFEPAVKIIQYDTVKEPNFPPYFDRPGSLPIYNINMANQEYQVIQLPDIYDPNIVDLVYDLIIEPEAKYFTIDAENSRITVDAKKVPPNFGINQAFKVTLSDKRGANREYSLLINFNRPGTVQKNGEKTVKSEGTLNCTAKIDSIDFYGNMTISFNASMFNQFNFSLLNESTVDIYIEPNLAQGQSLEERNVLMLNLSWVLTNYTYVESKQAMQMKIKLKFDNPFEISPNLKQDILVFHIKNLTQAFYSNDSRVLNFLHESSWTLRKNVKKQMLVESNLNEVLSRINDQINYALYSYVTTYAAVNVLGGGALKYFTWYLRSSQMIGHLPMLETVVPGNVCQFFQILIPLLTFDILDSEWTTMLIFDFNSTFNENDEDLSILQQMQDIGYETNNSILNLGSLWIFGVLYIVQVLFFILMKMSHVLTYPKKYCRKRLSHWSSVLFFSEVITIFIEGFFEFLIAAYLALECFLYDKNSANGDVASYWSAWLIVGILFIMIPTLLGYINFRPLERYKNAAFQRRFGPFFQGVNSKSKYNTNYFTVFVLRRFIFCSTAFYLKSSPSLQRTILICSNFLCLAYQSNRVFEDHMVQKFQAIEELITAFSSFTLIFFTDLFPMVDQNWVGWVLIIVVGSYFMIQEILFFYLAFLFFFRYFKFQYNKYCKKKMDEIFVPKKVYVPNNLIKINPHNETIASIINNMNKEKLETMKANENQLAIQEEQKKDLQHQAQERQNKICSQLPYAIEDEVRPLKAPRVYNSIMQNSIERIETDSNRMMPQSQNMFTQTPRFGQTDMLHFNSSFVPSFSTITDKNNSLFALRPPPPAIVKIKPATPIKETQSSLTPEQRLKMLHLAKIGRTMFSNQQ